jgi:hypothetical protein
MMHGHMNVKTLRAINCLSFVGLTIDVAISHSFLFASFQRVSLSHPSYSFIMTDNLLILRFVDMKLHSSH